MQEPIIEEFNYKLESDALLDIFSTAGNEEINKDNFEVLSNKHLTILILASGKGRSTIGNILSEMASSKALETLDKYPFHTKTPTEIIKFLKELFFTINTTLIEYLTVANIQDGSTTLSIAIVYKNSLYTAHTGNSRIYLIPRDETATLLSKDPSYSKRISKSTLSEKDISYYLGDATLNEEKVFVTQESNLHHKDTIFLSSNSILETLSENKFTKEMGEIKELLEKKPPSRSTSFLRYLHYERSVEVLRVEQKDIEEYETVEIDWEKIIPLIKKGALIAGVLIIILFTSLLLTQNREDEKRDDLNQTVTVNDNKSIPIVKETKFVATKEIIIEEEEKKEEVIENIEKIEKNPKIETPKTVTKKVIPQQAIPKEHSKPIEPAPVEMQTVKFLHKAESDLLFTPNIRITFKENQLIASKETFFYEQEKNTQILYGAFKANDSELYGEIIDHLQKQNYSDSVVLRKRENEINIKIHIKNSCHYTRSKWAKKSGLDLLTFKCEP